ncbi:MAG: type I-U CRISPR-associated protein Cas8c [Deltaproteobacteria bacterium]|nr:type I-U CRISPR-associated protein Cas8c [Deltaproteobacteria bacterium]
MSAGSNVAEASIPVDLFNPGQVFACLGCAEVAEVLFGGVEGCFDWSDRTAVRFRLRASGDDPPIRGVLRFLSQAKVISQAPHGSSNIAAWKGSWGRTPDELPEGAPYPSPDPESPATLLALLRTDEAEVRIDHWADTVRDNVKFWAGAGGYPGAALTRDAVELIREGASAAADDPFAMGVPQSSSFRLDWRRDYVPIDAGFSLNAHGGAVRSVGYPLVELLGAIGLTHARPRRFAKLEYGYGVVGASRGVKWSPLSFLRVALGAPAMPFETRRFRMSLSWPGKEGQARAITQVWEGWES